MCQARPVPDDEDNAGRQQSQGANDEPAQAPTIKSVQPSSVLLPAFGLHGTRSNMAARAMRIAETQGPPPTQDQDNRSRINKAHGGGSTWGSTPSTPRGLATLPGIADERRKCRRCRTSSWRIDGRKRPNGWRLSGGPIE